LLGVEVSKLPTKDVVGTAKGLQEQTQLIEWETVKPENKGNSSFDSK
jgi:hypothetical protein